MKPNIDIPKMDSHCAVVCEGKMYVYAGYIPEKAEYVKDIYAFDFEKQEWSVEWKGSDSRDEP